MKLYKIVWCFLLVFLTAKVSSQVINNGDFEDNSLIGCRFFAPNAFYNYYMNNSWGFGNGEGLDIQEKSCAFFSVPNGNWFVTLSKDNNGDFDALSLEISPALTMNNLYEISYYEHSTDTFSLNNIPLYIGLSLDSLSFGTFIHESTPEINTWTKRTFRFIAPNNGKYLTVIMPDVGELAGWNSVDKFEISNVTGIEEIKKQNARVYPNPAQDIVTIESDFQIIQVTIYDLLGNEVLFMNTPKSNIIQLNVSNLAPGYYLLKIQGVDSISQLIQLCLTHSN